jgi:putative transposase
MVTRQARREAVSVLVARGVSQRRACLLLGVSRATCQYRPRPDRNRALREEMRALAAHHPRYGRRRIWALLRRAGTGVNHKRVQRLWQGAQLQVPRRTRRRRRPSGQSLPQQAISLRQVWTYDFLYDRCSNGTPLKILTVLDEFSRECLTMYVATSIPASCVVRLLAALFAQRGTPRFLRSDNGTEFMATAVRSWLEEQHTDTLYIAPGHPWENGYIESFHGKLRDECLNLYAFHSVAEARVRLELFRQHYNERRPHSCLGYDTPAEVAARAQQYQLDRGRP